jgi:Xaa-Pro aminopeptidase
MLIQPIPAPTQLASPHEEPPHTPDFKKRRSLTWRSSLALEPSLKAIILCDPKDIFYLTGVREGIFWLVLEEGGIFGASRHMLVEEVRRDAPDCEILLPCDTYTPFADYVEFLITQLRHRGLDVAGFLPGKTSAQGYIKLTASASPDLTLKPLADVIAPLRAIKDEGELAITRRCVAIAEESFAQLLNNGAKAWIGRTERDIASELESRMCALGADRQGFPGTGIIIASGPNSASCHHQPGRRRILHGDTVLIDWGAELNGYRSDLTRTVYIETIPEYARRGHAHVEQSILQTEKELFAGANTGRVDQVARTWLTQLGYCEFYYGVGHGVGLEIHESPWLRMDGQDTLEENMITTLEPGIYLPKIGGIRIENMYRIKQGGCERLGSLPTALEHMVVS